MLRQRLRTRTSPLALIGRVLVFTLACALVFYGAMLALLALGVDPGTLRSSSGYRAAFNYLTGLQAGDLSDTVRIAAGIGGLLAFALFGYLALKEIPRPYLARHDLELVADEHGTVIVQPRAIERIAEAAASEHPGVTGAAGRYGGDDLAIGITVRRARDVATTLTDVQQRVATALERHGLPPVPVNLTLTGFDRRNRRELN